MLLFSCLALLACQLQDSGVLVLPDAMQDGLLWSKTAFQRHASVAKFGLLNSAYAQTCIRTFYSGLAQASASLRDGKAEVAGPFPTSAPIVDLLGNDYIVGGPAPRSVGL